MINVNKLHKMNNNKKKQKNCNKLRISTNHNQMMTISIIMTMTGNLIYPFQNL